MALIGNRSVLLKSPGRFLSGTIASIERSNFSPLRNRFEQMSRLSGVPSGHLSPSAWVLPQVGGGMSSHNFTSIAISGAASGAEGVNVSGSAALGLTAEAIGQLIASAIGSASFALDASGSIVATLGAPGSASFTLSATATATALGWMTGQSTASVTAALTSYATGALSGTANLAGESTPITPDSLAVAVWAAAAAANNSAGTMGEKLNDAGSGSNPWTEVIEAGYTAAEILRILAAHAAGSATGLEGANPQFTGLDGTTVRIDGTYSAGTRTIDSLDGA